MVRKFPIYELPIGSWLFYYPAPKMLSLNSSLKILNYLKKLLFAMDGFFIPMKIEYVIGNVLINQDDDMYLKDSKFMGITKTIEEIEITDNKILSLLKSSILNSSKKQGIPVITRISILGDVKLYLWKKNRLVEHYVGYKNPGIWNEYPESLRQNVLNFDIFYNAFRLQKNAKPSYSITVDTSSDIWVDYSVDNKKGGLYDYAKLNHNNLSNLLKKIEKFHTKTKTYQFTENKNFVLYKYGFK